MIKFIIAQGIGFTPGSVKYMPTLGFAAGAAVVVTDGPNLQGFLSNVGSMMDR